MDFAPSPGESVALIVKVAVPDGSFATSANVTVVPDMEIGQSIPEGTETLSTLLSASLNERVLSPAPVSATVTVSATFASVVYAFLRQ
jgi:hypothetical protein